MTVFFAHIILWFIFKTINFVTFSMFHDGGCYFTRFSFNLTIFTQSATITLITLTLFIICNICGSSPRGEILGRHAEGLWCFSREDLLGICPDIRELEIARPYDAWLCLEIYLIEPSARVARSHKLGVEALPIDAALAREPVALVESVVVRDVDRDDFVAYRFDKIGDLLLEQMVGVEANAK